MTYSVQPGRVKHLQSPVVGSKTGALPRKINAKITKCCFCLYCLLQSEHKCQTGISATLYCYSGLKREKRLITTVETTGSIQIATAYMG